MIYNLLLTTLNVVTMSLSSSSELYCYHIATACIGLLRSRFHSQIKLISGRAPELPTYHYHIQLLPNLLVVTHSPALTLSIICYLSIISRNPCGPMSVTMLSTYRFDTSLIEHNTKRPSVRRFW